MDKVYVDSLRENRERRNHQADTDVADLDVIVSERCCFRCGKVLSDPRSIALGVGPVCAQYLGIQAQLSLMRLPKDSEFPCAICGGLIKVGEKASWEFDTQGNLAQVAHYHCKDMERNGDKPDYENYE